MGSCIAALTSIDPGLFIATAVPALHLAARAVVIFTRTPAPGSAWAKAYSLIEVAALEVGRAKETGRLPPAAAHIDDFEKQSQILLSQLKANP
jgi:hypothetical protein